MMLPTPQPQESSETGGGKVRRRVVGFLFLLAEALSRTSRYYKEVAALQSGELRWYGVGIWLRGLGPGEAERVRKFFNGAGKGPGWWDASAGPRHTWFFAMHVEASTPERATLRCMEYLVSNLETAGVSVPDAARIEAEPMPAGFSPNVKDDDPPPNPRQEAG